MIYLLKHTHFDQLVNIDKQSIHTKHYQYLEMQRLAEKYDFKGAVTADIGSKTNFSNLAHFKLSRSRVIIDPYNGAPGGGLTEMPKLPYPCSLFRCAIGVDSESIPNNLFDITFSISVIEHIGQKEAGYDCMPTNNPPVEQEIQRDKFVSELFRITRPGGSTFHTVDHAARNLTYLENFKKNGWIPVNHSQIAPTVDECLNSQEAVRQRVDWTRPDIEMINQELHGVLVMGFTKPLA